MTGLDWVPQSCTLPTAERPLRVEEWDTLFTERLRQVTRMDPRLVRLELADGLGVEDQVRDLAERESGCCSFFAFTVTAEPGAVLLDVAVGPAHEPVLEALAARADAARGGDAR
ncbi:hypothetical protein [Streptomyces megasporus]|uniref:hypothetical protein n=1 Tax=Streptomyces megasporus TaxID=44060 RepID=UPI0004E245D3|nr:hypothetical protein [Streptomyces megasporus]